MTSSTDKERARRDEIEAAWSYPPNPVPKHPTTAEERPRTGNTIRNAIPDDFEVEEWSCTTVDFPKWKTVTSGDAHLSYVAEPLEVYHLAALKSPAQEGELSAVEVMYHNGKPVLSRIGFVGTPKGEWLYLPVMQVAKTIRELTS